MIFKFIQDKKVFLIFLIVVWLFCIKLNYHYFFTDEILYAQRGVEQLKGDFSATLQVPPLPKYFAGTLLLLFGSNTFLLRLPYALMGVASAYLVYLILKRQYNQTYGLLGALLFVTSRVIFDATRMVMLEAPMHLFWLLFHYYYFQTCASAKQKNYIIAGLFLGLSLSIKLTSLVLLPFIVILFVYQLATKKSSFRVLLVSYVKMLLSAISVYTLFYIHVLVKLGFITGIRNTLLEIKNIYIAKSDEGKIHVIGSKVFEKSPWWTYFYYHYIYNGPIRSALYAVFGMLSLLSKKFFVFYWGVFGALVFSFLQISGVKNYRYVSSIELPLIMLSVAGIYYLNQKFKNMAFGKILIYAISIISVTSLVVYLTSLNPTEYLAAYNYFKRETNNFTINKRMYIFGSIRSIRWYRDLVPVEDTFIFRRDFEITCDEFNTFDYIVFDKEELLKDPNNILYKYVSVFSNSYSLISELPDLLAFKKDTNSLLPTGCNLQNK